MCPVCKRKVFAHDEQPVPDSDSDSYADDTTPLINPVNRNHGTFARQNENPFQRAARSVSQITDGEIGYQNEGRCILQFCFSFVFIYYDVIIQNGKEK